MYIILAARPGAHERLVPRRPRLDVDERDEDAGRDALPEALQEIPQVLQRGRTPREVRRHDGGPLLSRAGDARHDGRPHEEQEHGPRRHPARRLPGWL